MCRAKDKHNRSGFTVIELLVVIAIIAVLVAISAGAYFRVLAGQAEKRSNTVIRQIYKGFETQWNATIDDAQNEIKNGKAGATLNLGLFNAAGSDPDRANALWRKMRLRQEFPQTFVEATTNAYAGYGVPPKAVYVQALAGLPASSYGNALPYESAILLYISLTQTRRGATFNAADLGGGSVSTTPYPPSNPSGQQFKIFVDSYGEPICFERWSTLDDRTVQPPYAKGLTLAVLAELSAPPYAPASGNLDTLDPYGKLTGTSIATSLGFMNLNQNYAPVIYSWGPDKTMATADDILSFRLNVQGQKGN